ncbi:DUF6969 family protein [Burkholderia glumae]|uniref:DUF6969 domain-containing protein n=1 Tax=Burkholderia glumae TaxID=337 RepID=A0AAP9Y5Z3_BURGL|nr:hypothetical protein [Burkholderia glumae]ACR32763.1 Hypothetical protein bglu_2p1040 [Burkholderia glumae BGR1]AJY62330.1 hypothetical protein KS03_5826 [Burkholderia glumae LMG 2196 = ATCC 33617]MCM2485742.1 hypothetical protein [Burkholderia glumae]MCM2511580.1 hypothetical protein [Burkholderia glumae]MCM2541672.1 hypothetical protein [Burkholderia glumae]
MNVKRPGSTNRRRQAALALVRCYETLAKRNENLLQHVIGEQPFECWRKYPSSEVISADGFQYFYHAHSADDRPGATENGHFHTFARLDCRARPVEDLPVPPSGTTNPIAQDPDSVHLIAISVDALGLPTGIFTVNQWVTGDRWCSSATLDTLSTAFRADGAGPSLVSLWVTSLFSLYDEAIRKLIRDRDATIQQAIDTHGAGYRITDDRTLEVLSLKTLSFSDDVDAALRDARVEHQERT